MMSVFLAIIRTHQSIDFEQYETVTGRASNEVGNGYGFSLQSESAQKDVSSISKGCQ